MLINNVEEEVYLKNKFRVSASAFGVVCLLDIVLIRVLYTAFIYLLQLFNPSFFTENENGFLEFSFSFNQSLVLNAVIQFFALIIIALVLKKFFKFDIKSIFKGSTASPTSYVKTFPVVMVINLVAGIVVTIVSIFISSNFGKVLPTADLEIKDLSPVNVAIYIFALSICAPLIEEILYRGILLGLLKPFNKNVAVFASALVFGIAHGNLEQALGAFIIGLLFGYITLHFNSILPAMILHSLNNLFAAVLSIVTLANSSLLTTIYYCVYALVFIAGICIIALNFSKVNYKKRDNIFDDSKGYKGVFLNIFVIIYLLYSLYMAVADFTNLNQ